jgi:hypothetical protein
VVVAIISPKLQKKGPCVLDGLAGLSLCVCMCIYIYMSVYMYIYLKSNMDLLLWARKRSENLVREACNHLAGITDKKPCVVNGIAGLPLSVFVCLYIYICACVCMYI